MNFICPFGFFVVTLQPKVAKIKALPRKFWSTKEQILREITENLLMLVCLSKRNVGNFN